METKRHKRKVLKFPETAYTYYIKQYCKKKGTSETKHPNVLVEATKSWLTLTEAEKQQLTKAYKEKEHKIRLHYFDQLKNAEPFLKVKNVSGQISKEFDKSNSPIQECQEEVEEDCLQIDTDKHQVIGNNELVTVDCNEDLLIDNVIEDLQINQELQEHGPNESLRNVEEISCMPLVEPSPPTIKTSKDLFFMLNSVNGSSTLNWTDLTPSQKSQYRSAVYLLKKDYINKYKEYLYSLAPKELFDYYHKIIF
ncbi:unnamed protein product [Spodoptera littoralis]|uniref:Uncharacterized protein n=1 Tax=Spodoptera littoralis TaxID=7109 RepID=A0A9P0I5B3_SPOLI|nr:unnamed protein product [Spodoptera littoralis]CAH1639689.1 unnamed protein product [Spodoptera littoralis]